MTLTIHADLGIVGTKAVGKQALVEWFTDWFGQFTPDYRFDVDEVRALGDRVFLCRHPPRARPRERRPRHPAGRVRLHGARRPDLAPGGVGGPGAGAQSRRSVAL